MMDFFLLLIVILLGLTVGSFANVCIHRMPREESIVLPASRCPDCHTKIKWYDNMPVFSYIILSGKCRSCHGHISLQYPIVEITTAILFAVSFQKFGGNPVLLLITLIFCTVLIITTVIDLKHRIVPDVLSYGLILLGLATAAWNTNLGPEGLKNLAAAALGALFGGGLLWILGAIGTLLFRKEAMGLGDVKLMAGFGSLMGWSSVIEILIIASFFGAIIGLSLILTKRIARKSYIPFVPFLALGALLSWFYNDSLLKILFLY